MVHFFKSFFFFFLIFSKLNSFGQTILKKITPNDGLSSYNVRSIITDPNGILWICTQDGLNKCNGREILTYNKDNVNRNHRLDFTDCRSMYVDSTKKELWVLGTESGINVIDYNTGNIKNRFLDNNYAEDDWGVVFEKINNELWIGTSQGLSFFTLNTKSFSAYNSLKHKNRISTLKQDNNGNVWLFINGFGVVVLDPKTKSTIKEISKTEFEFSNSDLEFTSSLIYGDTVLFGTTHGFRAFTFDKNYKLKQIELPIQLQHHLKNKSIYNITKIVNKIFVCTKNITVISDNFNQYEQICLQNKNDNIWLSEVNFIYPLSDSNIALGCNSGVAILNLKPPPINNFNNNDKQYSNKLKHVFSFTPLANGNFLTGTESGLYEININGISKTIESGKLVQNIAAINNEEYLISNKFELSIYKNNKLSPFSNIYSEFKNYQTFQFNSCKKLNNDIFILGTENDRGIIIWNKRSKTIQNISKNSTPISLPSDNVNTVFIDSKNRIFVLSDFVISVIENNTLRKITFDDGNKKAQLGFYFDMVEVNGNYWVATYGKGLTILDNNFKMIKMLNQENGLCNNGLYKIFASNNAVYVSSNNGISKINIDNYKIKNFFAPNDGIHGNSFEEACGAMVDGKIYFGGLDGFTVIDPSKIKDNDVAPKLYFQEINIETATSKIDTTNLFLQKLSIPNNYTQAKISFVGLNYQNPTRVNYWYLITELGTNWIDLKNQNFIDLIGISPGKYHLEVKAANEDGVECAPIKMELHFLPKWYQTLLFKILLALVVAGLLFLLYSFRIKQLKKILTVRQKISQNLHDDIGSTLSAINMYTQVAKLQPQENHFMDSIEENTKEVLGKLDDIIWSTNPKNDKIQNLVERMESFAMPLCKAKNVAFIFNHSTISNDNKISEATRQNLFVMFKEAVNNVLKYAQCKTCTVTLEEKNKNIYCTITDDGIGFETSKPTERNGLLNMQLRAKEIKGSCTITSELKKGTVVFIQLPL